MELYSAFVAKKLCPELILVKNRFWRYSEMSEKIMEIFHRYDPDMCPAGCDEGYLKCGLPFFSSALAWLIKSTSITAYCEEHSLTAEECVQQMRETVLKESQLTVSAGIAPNKVRPLENFWNGSNLSCSYRCSQKYVHMPYDCLFAQKLLFQDMFWQGLLHNLFPHANIWPVGSRTNQMGNSSSSSTFSPSSHLCMTFQYARSPELDVWMKGYWKLSALK